MHYIQRDISLSQQITTMLETRTYIFLNFLHLKNQGGTASTKKSAHRSGKNIMFGPTLLLVFFVVLSRSTAFGFRNKVCSVLLAANRLSCSGGMFSQLPATTRRTKDGLFCSVIVLKQRAERDAEITVMRALATSIVREIDKPYKLVVVESPSKAKTIEKILNSIKPKHTAAHQRDFVFRVESCYGHIRDLPTSAKSVPAKLKSLPWSTLGIDVENGFAPLYVTLPGKQHVIDNLSSLVFNENCLEVVLATDQDREGEAISWHLHQVFLDCASTIATTTAKKAVKNQRLPEEILPQMRRVTFNEITPKALLPIFNDNEELLKIHPKNSTVKGLDMHLVDAQECRRAVDRLAGYSMSPLLWKKITPGLSAGRVQSVGLQFFVKREIERMKFKSAEYWDLSASLQLQEQTLPTTAFIAKLTSINGNPVASGKDFNGTTGLLKESLSSLNTLHLTEEACQELHEKLEDARWEVQRTSSKQLQRSPPVPFITSTLQQEANSKLGFSVSDTMRVAQVLYEAGYITYMRTDSPMLSEDGCQAADSEVTLRFGEDFLSVTDSQMKLKESKRTRSKKKARVENRIEESHEAIRPAIHDGGFVEPSNLELHARQSFSTASKQLYNLIYLRTCASRMKEQVLNQTSVTVLASTTDESTQATFIASGSVVIFQGFARALSSPYIYTESFDMSSKADTIDGTVETEKEDSSLNLESNNLPIGILEGAPLFCKSIECFEHHTSPPPRFTEASFVKELERVGVGRPSTYSSIISNLRSRSYVGRPSTRTLPSGKQQIAARGSRISAQRAAGGAEFMGSARGPLFPSITAFVVCALLERYCPTFVDPAFTAEMELKLDRIAEGSGSRFSYLSEYYEGPYGLKKNVTDMMDLVTAEEARRVILPSLNKLSDLALETQKCNESRDIGLFIGPWGPYVQWVNPDSADTDNKPKAAPLPLGMTADLSTITRESLVALLETQERDGVILGSHPELKKNIRLKFGRFGAYLQVGETGDKDTTTHTVPPEFGGMGGRNIKMGDVGSLSDILTDETKETDESSREESPFGLSLEQAIKYVNLPRTVTELNGSPLIAGLGRYGPFLKYNNSYISIPREDDVLTIDAERAMQLVSDSSAQNHTGRKSRSTIASLGEKDGHNIEVCQGRFGFYLKWKGINAKIPADYLENPTEVPLEQAWSNIQDKAREQPNSRVKITKKSNALEVSLPPKPKRPLTSYLFFCAEKREEVSKKVKKLGEISKELARLWSVLEDKSQYENRASAARQGYENCKRAWEEQCKIIRQDSGSGSKSATRSTSKSPKIDIGTSHIKSPGVKKPISAYLHFAATHRSEISKSGSSFSEISKELSQRWKGCDDNARKPYEELAAADKIRYAQELGELPSIEVTLHNFTSTKKQMKRSPTAYMLFCATNRMKVVGDDGKKLGFGPTAKRLAEMWSECDAETKATFQAMATDAKLSSFYKENQQ